MVSPEFYLLSLHDALPIWFRCFGTGDSFSHFWRPIWCRHSRGREKSTGCCNGILFRCVFHCPFCSRSEEHTSELQSRGHLVCRLLLEKKKKTDHQHIHEDS